MLLISPPKANVCLGGLGAARPKPPPDAAVTARLAPHAAAWAAPAFAVARGAGVVADTHAGWTVASDGTTVAACWGVPTNFDALVTAHGGGDPSHTPASLTVALYAALGPSLAPLLQGGVSVALFDTRLEHALAYVAAAGAPTLAEARSPAGELLLAAGAPRAGAPHPLLPVDATAARAVPAGHVKVGWRADPAPLGGVGGEAAPPRAPPTTPRPPPSTPRGVPAGRTPARSPGVARSAAVASAAPGTTPPPTPLSLPDGSAARRTRRGKRAGRGVRERAAAQAEHRAGGVRVLGGGGAHECAPRTAAVAASAPGCGFYHPPPLSPRVGGLPSSLPSLAGTPPPASPLLGGSIGRADGERWWRPPGGGGVAAPARPAGARVSSDPPPAASAPAVVRFLYPQAAPPAASVLPAQVAAGGGAFRGGGAVAALAPAAARVGTGPFWPDASPPTPTPASSSSRDPTPPVSATAAAAAAASARPPRAPLSRVAADAAAVAAVAAGASPRDPAPAPERARETGFDVSPREAGADGGSAPGSGAATPVFAPPRALRRVPSSLSRALAACRSATGLDVLGASLASGGGGGGDGSAPPSPLAVPPPGLPRIRLGRSASCSQLARGTSAAQAEAF